MSRTARRLARLLALPALVAGSLGATCVPNPNQRDPVEMGGAVGVGYEEIQTDLATPCLTGSPVCHAATNATNNLKFGSDLMANYQLVVSFVDTQAPESSPLLLKSLGMGTPAHGGGVIFPSSMDATYQKVLKWIQDGLVFDPNVKRVVYADIEADMNMSCLTTAPSCHSPATTTNNLKVGTDSAANYTLITSMFIDKATPANSPLLLKALGMGTPMHTGGVIFPSTQDATYQKWLGWITAGAPER